MSDPLLQLIESIEDESTLDVVKAMKLFPLKADVAKAMEKTVALIKSQVDDSNIQTLSRLNQAIADARALTTSQQGVFDQTLKDAEEANQQIMTAAAALEQVVAASKLTDDSLTTAATNISGMSRNSDDTVAKFLQATEQISRASRELKADNARILQVVQRERRITANIAKRHAEDYFTEQQNRLKNLPTREELINAVAEMGANTDTRFAFMTSLINDVLKSQIETQPQQVKESLEALEQRIRDDLKEMESNKAITSFPMMLDPVDGSKWYNAAGAPTTNLGQTDDYYLNDTSSEYYKKVNNRWALQGTLSGGGGGGTTYALAESGTGHGYPELTGLVNGSNRTYVVPEGEFVTDSAQVIVGGITIGVTQYTPTAATGTILFDVGAAPPSGTFVQVRYGIV